MTVISHRWLNARIFVLGANTALVNRVLTYDTTHRQPSACPVYDKIMSLITYRFSLCYRTVCVLHSINRSLYPSTSSTPSDTVSALILHRREIPYKLCGHIATIQAATLLYQVDSSIVQCNAIVLGYDKTQHTYASYTETRNETKRSKSLFAERPLPCILSTRSGIPRAYIVHTASTEGFRILQPYQDVRPFVGWQAQYNNKYTCHTCKYYT